MRSKTDVASNGRNRGRNKPWQQALAPWAQQAWLPCKLEAWWPPPTKDRPRTACRIGHWHKAAPPRRTHARTHTHTHADRCCTGLHQPHSHTSTSTHTQAPTQIHAHTHTHTHERTHAHKRTQRTYIAHNTNTTDTTHTTQRAHTHTHNTQHATQCRHNNPIAIPFHRHLSLSTARRRWSHRRKSKGPLQLGLVTSSESAQSAKVLTDAITSRRVLPRTGHPMIGLSQLRSAGGPATDRRVQGPGSTHHSKRHQAKSQIGRRKGFRPRERRCADGVAKTRKWKKLSRQDTP